LQRKIRRQIKRRLQQKTAKALWSTVAAAGLMLGVCGYTLANPTDGTVTSGTATISGAGTPTVTVTQTTDKAAINWSDFNIGSGETVAFIQPGTSSIALNRVTGSNASEIYGTLSSNGKVYLINPNGILFASTAQVNVGGIVAAALDISDTDFNAGNYTFSGNGKLVNNEGTISATDGGYVVLLGKQVVNSGTITAGSGTVALGAGNHVTLDFEGDGLLGLTVDGSVLGALTQNSGTISADGGSVYLSAAAADSLAGTVVNNSGIIRARSVSKVNGKIVLSGGTNGTVTNSGTLDAAGTDSGETGGTVKMLGETVELAAGGQIDSSGASGGGTVVLSATDNITVAGIICNTGGSGTIKLRADSDADTSGTVAFGGGKLVTTDGTVEIYYNPSGTTTTTINGVATTVKDYTHPTDYSGNINLSGEGALTSYMLVNNVNELQAVNLNLGGTYALGGDIDAGSTAIWNPDGNGGYSGFTPLGEGYPAFTGVFDGGGHTIRNLYINRPATNYVGLFRYSRGAISNLGLKDGNIAGKIEVGGLVGANFGIVSDSYNTGEVRGTRFYVGGLAGYNGGDILRSYNTGNVSSNQGQVGGLIGMNYGNLVDSHNSGIVSSQVNINSNRVGGLVGSNYGHITTSYNTGSVSASSWGAGGIAGENDGSIINSYNSGAITGGVPSCGEVGGLAGLNDGGLITNSYNTGVVNSTKYVGGLVGNSDNGGGIIGSFNAGVVSGSESSVGGLVGYNGDADSGDYILNSYNTGPVRGESNVGGLVGWNWGSITNSYNTGLVSGSISSSTGGLVGYYQETIITIVNSYWDIRTSGTARGVGIDRSFDHLGRTTAEMMTQSNYPQVDGEWDFTNVWGMIDGVSYPYLKCFYQDTPLVISGTVSSGGGQTVQTVLNGTALSSVATGANGFYYMLFTNGTIADHDALLAYVDNGDGNGNAVYGVSGVNASITGLDITADTVSVDSDTPSLALTNLLN
jgi:filamentous hemagglutinin family protein